MYILIITIRRTTSGTLSIRVWVILVPSGSCPACSGTCISKHGVCSVQQLKSNEEVHRP